jgi:Domain of unknown function (DUF4173)
VRWLALAAALCAAAVIPAGPAGIGILLVAALVAATAAAARRPNARTVVLGSLALALATFASVRDAGWVVAIDLTAAWMVASLAVAGPRLAAVTAPLVRLRDVPTITPSGTPRLAPAVRGTVLGGFVVVPFAALFFAADAAFAELGGRMPVPPGESLPLRAAIFVVVLAGALGLTLAARRPLGRSQPRELRRLAPIEWAIPLASLVGLFGAFVAVQLAVLFGGHDHVLETAGLTYAEYAREGFWELLVAGALTLVVIAAAARFAVLRRRRDQVALKGLLGALCALTLVVLASALHRLDLYEDVYGLTRLRLTAEAAALWLGGAFVLVAAAGVAPGIRARLGELATGLTAAALIAFSLVNPDALIAKRNVEHWRETGRIDVSYLSGLSADAVPELTRLPDSLRAGTLRELSAQLAEDDPWSSANLGRARARDALRARRRPEARVRSRPRRPPRMPRSRIASETRR